MSWPPENAHVVTDEFEVWFGTRMLVPEHFRPAVDSTLRTAAVTGDHVHVQAQDAAAACRASGNEAAGSGEQLDAG